MKGISQKHNNFLRILHLNLQLNSFLEHKMKKDFVIKASLTRLMLLCSQLHV